MARPRKQTYTLEMYLKKNMKGDIDNNADVQRNFVWKNEQINELVVTILTDDYISPIILGEEENSKLHIVDGGCRTAALIKFRYMNYKITSAIENSVIPYKKKVVNNGKTTYEDAVFDIKNKTYERLPEELKEKFNEYQIETVIHENCDSFKISKYIKRYNNHVSMNNDQKAFTYIDVFAREIREITGNRFFLDIYTCTQKGKINGTIERVAAETVLLCNYPDMYKKYAKQNFKWLNENACISDFESVNDLLVRLASSVENTKEIQDLFNSKHTHIFAAAFKAFTELGRDDRKFGNFLKWFVDGGNETVIDGKAWNDLLSDDKKRSTRDPIIIRAKLDYLTVLIDQYVKEIKKIA